MPQPKTSTVFLFQVSIHAGSRTIFGLSIRSQNEPIKTLFTACAKISKIYPTLSELDKTRSGIAAFVSDVYSTFTPSIIDEDASTDGTLAR